MSDQEQQEAKAPGVGKVAMEAILGGATNEEAFNLVREQFPDKKTSMASINWYRNKLRGDGHAVKTSRELRAEKEGAAEGGEKPKKAKKAKKAKTTEAGDPLN